MIENPNRIYRPPRHISPSLARTQKDTHQTVIQCVRDPQPKRRLGEKHISLSERIQLRIPIQHARRHELIKDADHKRWEDSKEDVVKRDRP